MRQVGWLAFLTLALLLSGCTLSQQRDTIARRLPSPWTTLKQTLPEQSPPSNYGSSRP